MPCHLRSTCLFWSPRPGRSDYRTTGESKKKKKFSFFLPQMHDVTPPPLPDLPDSAAWSFFWRIPQWMIITAATGPFHCCSDRSSQRSCLRTVKVLVVTLGRNHLKRGCVADWWPGVQIFCISVSAAQTSPCELLSRIHLSALLYWLGSFIILTTRR